MNRTTGTTNLFGALSGFLLYFSLFTWWREAAGRELVGRILVDRRAGGSESPAAGGIDDKHVVVVQLTAGVAVEALHDGKVGWRVKVGDGVVAGHGGSHVDPIVLARR